MNRTRNPLPQLILSRLQQVKNRIGQTCVRRSQELAVRAGPVNRDFVDLPGAAAQAFTPIVASERFGVIETNVGGRNRNNVWANRWLRISLPGAQSDDERGNRHLAWACNGETTVFIDGQPWAGLDPSHLSCPLPDRACELWLDVGLYHTCIGGPGYKEIDRAGVEFLGAHLEIRDPQAWEVYQDLDVLTLHIERLTEREGIKPPAWGLGWFPEIRSAPPLLRHLLADAEAICDADAAGGLAAVRKAAKAALSRFGAESWQPEVHLVGHSHLDLLWLWPESVTIRKGLHTMATQFRLMERYPGFRFTMSQPAFVRALAVEAPAQHAQLRRYIEQGRLELLGGFEVEPDTHLPCGEALARSLVHGQSLIAELTGKPSTICWQPDAFGFSACLPQILRLGGVTSFFTSKMASNAINRFPYVAFVWRGNDGSEVDALCMPHWNDNLRITTMDDLIRDHAQLAIHPEMLMPVGIGDGGGGVTETICERADRLRDRAGLPRCKWSSAQEYFVSLAEVRDRLPVYQGELYLELHRGTFTSQARFKGIYRALERALQTWEAASAVRGGGPIDAVYWRRLAFAQFHDALPGSSIGLVYQQVGAEFEQRTDDAIRAAHGQLANTSGEMVIFNPLPLARTAVVTIPGRHTALSIEGRDVPAQPVGEQTLALVELAALAAVPIRLTDKTNPAKTTIQATPNMLDNGRVRALFDTNAQLAGLSVDGFDLRLEQAAGLRLHHDQPAFHDAWDIDDDALDHVLPLPAGSAMTVVEQGPVRGRLRATQQIGERSHATIDYVLDAAQPWLQVEIAIEWREQHRLLKYHLPTCWRGRMARFGTPFGSITRPQWAGGSQDEAMWEVPVHRWLVVGDDAGQGLAVVTEASYGTSVRDGDVGLSLLRAPTYPDPQTDQGSHLLRFAIGRYFMDSDLDGAAAAADRLYTPPLLVNHGQTLEPPFSWTRLGTLLPSWVEPIQGGMILRAHETLGAYAQAELQLARPARTVEYVDLLGQRTGPVRKIDHNRYIVPAGPCQIVSIRVLW